MHANRFYFKLSFVVTSIWQKLAGILCLLTRRLMMVLSLCLDASRFGPRVPKATDPL